jgi:iron complex outermembrane receptor protein
MKQRNKNWVMGAVTVGWMGMVSNVPGAPPPVAPLEPLVVVGELAAGSVLLERDLELFQTDSVAGLTGLIPGFNVVTSDTRGYGDILSMRGSTNTLFFSPPAVGMTVDDVPLGEVFSYPSGLLAMDQVRLLRGPQGAGYGRNGAAGMIEMTTPAPGAATEAVFTLDGGSYDSFGAHLRTGGPLGAGFAHTLQLYHQQRDGFIDNTYLGRATDDRSLTGGLVNLYWQPAPDTEWRLRVLTEQADDGSQRLSSLASPDPFEVQSDIPGENELERTQVSLHWTQQGPWGRVKSITAWQDWSLDPSITDLDLMAVPGDLYRSTIIQDQEMFSQEFRWESPENSGPWSWRTGAFFMNVEQSGDATRDFPYKMILFGFPLSFPTSERTLYDINQWNLATYGRVTYELNPELDLHAGARLEYFESEIDRTKKTATTIPGVTVPDSLVSDDLGEWYVSPELGATYAFNETTRLFARSAIGIKPAGFSAFASNPAQARYDEETAWANELGIEITAPAQHLAFSFTGFWNLIDDYQMNQGVPNSTDFITVNAGEVTSLGVESQVRWQPLTGLTLLATAGYASAELDSTDKEVPYVPDFTGSVGVRYELPKGFYAQTSLRTVGTTYFDEANTSSFQQGSYVCWDAEIGYAMEHFSIALYGRNLSDEEYYTFINPQINAGAPGDPQVFGVRATLEF